MVMLEQTKLNVTVDIPDVIIASGMQDIEETYSTLARFWIEYSEDDWVMVLLDDLWQQCDDSRTGTSRINHIEHFLTKHRDDVEKHFDTVCNAITGHHLPSQIDVKPSGIAGVVLWSTT